jgi:predicted transcriptional regulator
MDIETPLTPPPFVEQHKVGNFFLYNKIDALLPLFGLKEIPLFTTDGKPSLVWGTVDGEEKLVQETRPIELNSSDFLVMRCIAKHENANILRLIKVSEEEIARECGISRSTVARSLESSGESKLVGKKVGTEQRQVGQGFIDSRNRGHDRNGHPLSKYKRINRDFLRTMEDYLPHYMEEVEKAKRKKSPDLEVMDEYKQEIDRLLAQEMLEEQRAA